MSKIKYEHTKILKGDQGTFTIFFKMPIFGSMSVCTPGVQVLKETFVSSC